MATRIPVQKGKATSTSDGPAEARSGAAGADTPPPAGQAAAAPSGGGTDSGSMPAGGAAVDPTPASGDLAQEIADLRRQLEEKDAELRRREERERDAADQVLRARADLENVRRRARQEREEAAQFGTQELLRDLLPALDNLERALSVENVTVESLREGVELTMRQLLNAMRKHGVEPLDSAGQPFDANLHDAIMRAEPTEEHPAGTVVDEIQKGYTLRGRLLRPSLVRVAGDG